MKFLALAVFAGLAVAAGIAIVLFGPRLAIPALRPLQAGEEELKAALAAADPEEGLT